MDVAAEHLQTGRLVLLQQRRTGETDEHRVGHHRLHHPVELAALGAMALVDEDEDLAHGLARLAFQVRDEGVEVVDVAAAELVNEAAQQARLGLAELVHQIWASPPVQSEIPAPGEHRRWTGADGLQGLGARGACRIRQEECLVAHDVNIQISDCPHEIGDGPRFPQSRPAAPLYPKSAVKRVSVNSQKRHRGLRPSWGGGPEG